MKNTLTLILLSFCSLLGFAQTNSDVLYFVQEMPTYPGGQEAMLTVLYENIVYPEYEKSMNIEGSVFIEFIVEKDGTPTNFRVTRGVEGGAGLDAEALKACQKLGKFNPGKQNGEPHRVYLTIPIKFSFSDDSEEEPLTKAQLKKIEKDSKRICEYCSKMTEASLKGDKKGLDKTLAEFEKFAAQIDKEYPTNSTQAKELERVVSSCIEEAMKAVLGGK